MILQCNTFLINVIFLLLKLIVRSKSEVITNIDVDKLNEEKPVEMVIMLARHGHRTAGEATYDGDPIRKRVDEIWPEGLLQLTNNGRMEQYELGKWIRKRYDKLLGDYFSSETLFALTTSPDRNIMSVMCVMAGLYPPKGYQIWNPNLLWQPIPVHSYGGTANNLLNAFNRVNCPKYWEEFNKMLKSDEYIRIWNSQKELREYIYNNTKYEMKDYKDVDYLFDYIESQIRWNLTVPAWTNTIYPEPWRSAALYYFILPTFNEPLKRLFLGPLLKEVTQQFQGKVLGKNERKLYFLSGHDDNISNLLNFLGVFNGIMPPFSATIMIELRKDIISNNYFVTLFYKNATNEAHLLKINGCESVCLLERFYQVLNPYIPENWEKECILTDSATNTKGIFILVIFIQIILILNSKTFY